MTASQQARGPIDANKQHIRTESGQQLHQNNLMT
jgi:hypothetical protein